MAEQQNSEPQPVQRPVWDGQRYVYSEVRRAWEEAQILARHEDITQERSWSDVLCNHTVIVNLGGVTRRFEAELDDGRRSLQPPTVGYMSVLPAGRAFAGRFQGHTNHYAMWQISPPFLTRLAQEAGMTHAVEITPRLSHRDALLHDSIRCLAELAESPDTLSELEGACVTRKMGLHLIAEYGIHKAQPSRRPGALLSRRAVAALQDYVDARLADKITLADLSVVAGHAAHNLLIGFRQRFAVTPHQYVLEQRLKRALWQLIHTARPIAEIAYDVGFASQSHMTSAFKSRFRMTPSAARQSFA